MRTAVQAWYLSHMSNVKGKQGGENSSAGSLGMKLLVRIHVNCTQICEQKDDQREDGLSQEVVRELVVNGLAPFPEIESVTRNWVCAVADYTCVISANYHRAECKRQ